MRLLSVSASAMLTVICVVLCGEPFVRALGAGHASVPWCAITAYPLQVAETETVRTEFEGRYKVGTTTCTVKPIKMAFEVRWAKGKGAIYFFFHGTTPDGKAVFVSEDAGRGTDTFVFDDNRYNSGTFLRADGKRFAVQRAR